MKRSIYGLMVLISLAACNKKEENTTTVDVPELQTSSAIEAATAGGIQSNPTTYTVPEAQQVQQPAAGVKLNPPHGEPGHLCEIPVGDPLPVNGVAPAAQPAAVTAAPARPMPISPSATSVINTPINTSVPTGPKPKFNPPHGQPWHTCDLEVGAPLS